MLEYSKQNIFLLEVDAYVNPVNCIGVMGGGLAAQFKYKYPQMFADYSNMCARQRLLPGRIHSFYEKNKWIINFPTKVHYKNPSKIEYIEQGFIGVDTFLSSNKISSMAFPKLGCGLGGLDWNTVKPLMINKLTELDKKYNIHFVIVE